MRLDRGQIEVVEEAMAAVLRRKTGAERLRIANSLYGSTHRQVIHALQVEHPHWDDERVRAEAAPRLLHGSG